MIATIAGALIAVFSAATAQLEFLILGAGLFLAGIVEDGVRRIIATMDRIGSERRIRDAIDAGGGRPLA